MLRTGAKQWLSLLAVVGLLGTLTNCVSTQKRSSTDPIIRLKQEIAYESNKLKASSKGSSLWSTLKKVKKSGLKALSEIELYRLDSDDFILVQALIDGSLVLARHKSDGWGGLVGGTGFFLEGYSGITGVAVDDMLVKYVGRYTYITAVDNAPKTVLKFKVFTYEDARKANELVRERIRMLESELEALQEEKRNRRKSY